jgi:3-phenylpropionate/trans-cinnamate dioxygenase ferredoxin component
LPPGKFLKVTVAGKGFLIANLDGAFYAVENLCSHEDYPLSYGCLHGDAIKCSLHGSRFSLKTGAPLDAPADTPVATFAVAVSDGQIWLDPSRRAN